MDREAWWATQSIESHRVGQDETTLPLSLFKHCSVRKHVTKGMIMQKNYLFFAYLLFFGGGAPKCEGFQLKHGSLIL